MKEYFEFTEFVSKSCHVNINFDLKPIDEKSCDVISSSKFFDINNDFINSFRFIEHEVDCWKGIELNLNKNKSIDFLYFILEYHVNTLSNDEKGSIENIIENDRGKFSIRDSSNFLYLVGDYDSHNRNITIAKMDYV